MHEKKGGKNFLKNNKKKKILVGLGILVILTVGCIFLLRSTSMQIDTVIVSGNRILGEGELVGVVKNVTGGKYVYLIPKTSSIFYPKKDIIQGLLAYSARIKSVSVAKEGLKKSIITISERQPLYVWCESTASPEKSCLYIDVDGIAFAFAPSLAPGIVFEFYNNDANKKAEIGNQVIRPEDMAFINTFRSNVATSTPLSPSMASVLPFNDYEIKTKEGPTLLFSKEEDPTKIAAALNTFFISTPAKEAGFIEHPDLLDKIDLRFGQKIFYTLSKYQSHE
jgi:hypothetical protein